MDGGKSYEKIISVLLVLVLCIVAMPTVVFADSTTTDTSPLGVITDADGNVVEVLTLPRTIPADCKYVDGLYTIPKG